MRIRPIVEQPRSAGTFARDNSNAAARALVHRLFSGVGTGLAVELGDGTRLFDSGAPIKATIVVRNAGTLRLLIAGPNAQAVASAVVRGDIGVTGDIEWAIACVEQLAGLRKPADWFAILLLSLRLPVTRRAASASASRLPFHARGRKHSRRRDRAAIEYHYDVSNEFFALWLDRELTYSCAYFRGDAGSLDAAQVAKLDHICKKLRLRAGERLLDIGCGWGSLVRYAAREYGARVTGITLSARQAEYARARIAREGLDGTCAVELRDYRDVAPLGRFDKIASVGMVEHVGSERLGEYFASAYAALEPGGLFLNHGIASQRKRPAGLRRLVGALAPPRSEFIERYVFPDGNLPRLEEIVARAEASGFEVRDVENLREHYVRTLRQWVQRLEAHEHAARSIVGDETYNVWRFYMAGSAHGFAAGRMGIDQVLLAKPLPGGRALLPPTRDDIYQTR